MNPSAVIFVIVTNTILIVVASSADSNEDINPLMVEPEPPRPREGRILKDSAYIHKIQERRTGAKTGTRGPGTCNYQGRFGIRNDCDRFWFCQRAGTIPRLGFCPPNKRFHHQMRKCLHINMEECRATMCKTTLDKFPDPYARENYLSCYRMFPTVSQCPENHIYDEDKKSCVEGSPIQGFKSSYETDPNAEKEEDASKDPIPFQAMKNEDEDSPDELAAHNGALKAKDPGAPKAQGGSKAAGASMSRQKKAGMKHTKS